MTLSDRPAIGQLLSKKDSDSDQQGQPAPSPIYDASAMLEAAQRNNIHFSLLVDETAIWASREAHKRLVEENNTG